MKLNFFGAARTVTGSCFLLEAADMKILIDCGMQQGKDLELDQGFSFNPGDIDFVILTHAHIDHAGKLPLLIKDGFRGQIICTHATLDLCSIMLVDSGHIQENEAIWHNRKRQRAGKPQIEPLYTVADAQKCMNYFKSYEYETIIHLSNNVKLRFTDAGHLLGSASIELWITENRNTEKIVFSGDIGNINKPIIGDPKYITEADYVVTESTYGDRNHDPEPDHKQTLADIIKETFDRGGNVVIPSFAVGRTQELLYFLRDILENDLIPGWKNFPVYVDSPLGIAATEIFNKDYAGYYDTEAMELVKKGINPLTFPSLHIAQTQEESQLINTVKTPAIIISSSGMCEAGRIKHHLKHNLWRSECTILFAGYQAVGTLGRSLADGAKTVHIFGEEIDVNAQIRKMEGFSGHADKAGLVRWITSFNPKPKKIFVIHGESSVSENYAKYLQDEYNLSTIVPSKGSIYDFENDILHESIEQSPCVKNKKYNITCVITELDKARERLFTLIRQKEKLSLSNDIIKNLAELTNDINSIYNKWSSKK